MYGFSLCSKLVMYNIYVSKYEFLEIYDLFGLYYRPVVESSETKSEPINLFGLMCEMKSSGMGCYVLVHLLESTRPVEKQGATPSGATLTRTV